MNPPRTSTVALQDESPALTEPAACQLIDETRFQVFYEDSPSMSFVVDAAGIIRSCNRFGADCLGYQSAELINQPVDILFHAVDRQAAHDALTRAFTEPGVLHQWDFRKRTKAGALMWVHETVRVIQQADGHAVALIVCQDISAQKRTEAEILEQEQAIRSLQQATGSPGVPFEQTLQTVLELGCRRFNLPIGAVTRVEGDTVTIEQVWPPTGGIQPGLSIPLCQSYCATTLNTDGVLCIEHAGATAWRDHPAYRDLRFESYFGMKLSGTLKTYGTICFFGYAPYPSRFTQAQTDFLTLMAHWISREMDRRSAEQALRESREFFALAFRVSPHPLIITEWETGRCLEANNIALRSFGFAREEVIGHTTVSLGLWPTPEDRTRFLARLAQEGHLRDMELCFRSKSGDIRPYRVSCEPLTLRGIRCLLTVGQDIREQQRAETALRDSEERFRHLFEDAPVGMCIVGPNCTIRKANPAFLALTGYEEDEIIGQTYALYTHPDDLPGNLALSQQFLGRTIPGYTYEKRYIRKNGTLIWVSVTVSPLASPGTDERLGVAIIQDITARKLAEQTLAQRERDLRQALEDRQQVSQDLHDGILQSLYAVGLSLDATGRLVGTAPRRAKQALSGAISQLNRTIQEIRSFVTTLSFDLLDAARFTQAMQSVVASFCTPGQTRCDILVSPEASRRLARSHGVHVINIVREAVSNSVRHGQATRVRVTLRALKDRVQLAVKDNGHGFDPEAAMKRGYGMRNMRARAAKIGGLLRITSTPDTGTRIVVTFNAEEHRDESPTCAY